MIKLTYCLVDGRQFTKLVNPKLIAQIEEDPRHKQSNSIVHMLSGEKMFCTQTMDELQNMITGN